MRCLGADLTEEEQKLLLSDTACEVSNIDALFENMLRTRRAFTVWIMSGYFYSRFRSIL